MELNGDKSLRLGEFAKRTQKTAVVWNELQNITLRLKYLRRLSSILQKRCFLFIESN